MLRQGYGLADLRADAFAGLTVAVVALPLSMALAIASGASPSQGLVTAVVAGLLISLLGGSRYQIGGPTGAFVVIVYGIIATHGYDGLVLATLIAGVLLVIAALCRAGRWIRYIPDPVVTGFTSGIAVVIACGQIADFLGIRAAASGEVIGKLANIWAARGQLDPVTLGLGLGCMAAILSLRRWAPRLPGFLIAVVGAALLAALAGLPVATIGERFGAVPSTLPLPHVPAFSLTKALAVLPAALTIAFLAGVESLLSCMVADGMTGSRHKSNAELMGQGVANIGSAVFGGLPATGALARTATNIRSGARSPLAGVIHALAILAFMALAAPWIAFAPFAALSAILFVVAWNMAEPHRFAALLKGPLGDRVVLLTTFGLTVFSDLTVAIAVGVVMSSMRFMHRMAESVTVEAEEREDEDDLHAGLPPGVEVYRFTGPLFFGAASRLDEFLSNTGTRHRAIILRLEETPFIDATGVRLLSSFIGGHRARGLRVILCGLHGQTAQAMAGELRDGESAETFEAAKAMAAAL